MQILLLWSIWIRGRGPLDLLWGISDIAPRYFWWILLRRMGLRSLSHLSLEVFLALSSRRLLLRKLELIDRILLLTRWLLLELCLRSLGTSNIILSWWYAMLLYPFLSTVVWILRAPVISTPVWWHCTVTAFMQDLVSRLKTHSTRMSWAGNLNYWLTIWRFFHFVNIIIWFT